MSTLAYCIYQVEQSYHSRFLSAYNHKLMVHTLEFGGNQYFGCKVKRHCRFFLSSNNHFSRQVLEPLTPTFFNQSGWYFACKLLLLRASYTSNFALTTLFVCYYRCPDIESPRNWFITLNIILQAYQVTHIQPFSPAQSINLTQFKTFLSSECSFVQATEFMRCV